MMSYFLCAHRQNGAERPFVRETVLYNVLKNKINKSVVMGSCLPSLQVTDSTNLLYHLHTAWKPWNDYMT